METSADLVGPLELGWPSRVVLPAAKGLAFLPLPQGPDIGHGLFPGRAYDLGWVTLQLQQIP